MITLSYSYSSEASGTANDTQTRLTRTSLGGAASFFPQKLAVREKLLLEKHHVTRKTQLLPLSVTWLARLVQTNTEKTTVQRGNGLITGGS